MCRYGVDSDRFKAPMASGRQPPQRKRETEAETETETADNAYGASEGSTSSTKPKAPRKTSVRRAAIAQSETQ